MNNPDKYIRKYFYDTLSGMVINGKIIPVYDSHTPNNDDYAIILSTQSGSDDWMSKCSVDKNREIIIDIFTRYSGHVGSRAFLDDIVEETLERTKKITIENFTVQYYNVNYPSDLTLVTNTETVFRKLINYSIKLK